MNAPLAVTPKGRSARSLSWALGIGLAAMVAVASVPLARLAHLSISSFRNTAVCQSSRIGHAHRPATGVGPLKTPTIEI